MPETQTMRIAWGNHCFGLNSTAVTLNDLTAVSTSLGAANVLDTRVKKLFRATTSTTPQIQVDLGSSVASQVFAVLGHNLTGQSPAATVRIMLGTSSGASDVYDSGALSIFEVPYTGFPKHFIHVASSEYTARYLTVEFGNAPATLEVGGVWASRAWQTAMQPTYRLQTVDMTETDRSRGGQVYGQVRNKYRRYELRVNQLDYPKTFSDELNAQRMLIEAGTGKPIILLPKTDTSEHIHRLGLYGHISGGGEIQHREQDNYEMSLTVSEAL